MKKLFFSSSGSGSSDYQNSFVGKVFSVGRHQCTVEEVVAEGRKIIFLIAFNFPLLYIVQKRGFEAYCTLGELRSYLPRSFIVSI